MAHPEKETPPDEDDDEAIMREEWRIKFRFGLVKPYRPAKRVNGAGNVNGAEAKEPPREKGRYTGAFVRNPK